MATWPSCEPSGVTLTDFHGERIKRDVTRVLWDPIQAEKGGYKHFMLKEIFEQPRSIRDTTLGRISLDTGTVHLSEMKISDDEFRAASGISIAACGTSWHAALAGKYMIERLARVPVDVDYAKRVSLPRSDRRSRRHRSADHSIGRDCGHPGRPARDDCQGREDDSHLQRGGSRRGARGTWNHLHACRPGNRRRLDQGLHCPAHGTVSLCHAPRSEARHAEETDSKELMDALNRVPGKIEEILRTRAGECEQLALPYSTARDFLYLGRGIHFPIALEGALKLKEISYIHAEGYPAGEMKHGPNALIDETLPVVVLATKDDANPDSILRYEKTLSNIQEVTARAGKVIAISTEGDTQISQLVEHVIFIPNAPELLLPVLEVVPLQLLAYYIAVRRGCDVDQPRNLAKSVTVE